MPKIKTNRSAAKRFKRTATGKIKRRRPFANHILTKKTTKRKRNLRQPSLVHKSDEERINRLIPY
jgi:large subunit ribosomal protein L35